MLEERVFLQFLVDLLSFRALLRDSSAPLTKVFLFMPPQWKTRSTNHISSPSPASSSSSSWRSQNLWTFALTASLGLSPLLFILFDRSALSLSPLSASSSLLLVSSFPLFSEKKKPEVLAENEGVSSVQRPTQSFSSSGTLPKTLLSTFPLCPQHYPESLYIPSPFLPSSLLPSLEPRS